jgi:hypothetical protein
MGSAVISRNCFTKLSTFRRLQPEDPDIFTGIPTKIRIGSMFSQQLRDLLEEIFARTLKNAER